MWVPARAGALSECFPDLVFLVFANAGVVAKLNPATATISDDAIKAIVLVLKLLMFSLGSFYMIRGIFQYEDDTA